MRSPDVTPLDGPPGLRDWHLMVVLALIVCGFFSQILLGRTFLWEDFLLQFYPFRNFAAVSLASGELPLWNPYAFAGMPFQADIQSAVFYVPHLLLTLFVHHGVLSFRAVEVMLIAHYPLAAIGMFVLARDAGLPRLSAFFAALGYALSGFMIVHAVHPGFVEQAAWLPWIILALHRAIQRRSVRYALATGLLAGHAVLAGAPQISLFIFLLMAAFSAVAFVAAARKAGVRASVHAIWLPLLAVLVAFGVAAIQILPTMELAPLSERDTLSFAAAQAGRLDWSQLITALMPKFFGAHSAAVNTYWGGGLYGTYWETCFYWGIPMLFAALLALSVRRANLFVRFLGGIVVVSFLLAVGDHFFLHRLFYTLVPGFASFRVPARIVLLATFAMPLLAAIGLRDLVELGARTPQVIERRVITIAVVVLLIVGAVWSGVLQPAPDSDLAIAAIARAKQAAITAAVIAFATCGLALVLTRRLLPPLIVVAALFVLQLGDIAWFGYQQNNGLVDAEAYYHGKPQVRDVVVRLKTAQQSELFRVTSRDGRFTMFDRNLGMLDQLPLTEGYTPLRLRRRVPPAATAEQSLDLLNAKYRVTADSVAGTLHLRTVATYFPRVSFVPADTVIADDSAAARYMRQPTFNPRETVVLSSAPQSAAVDTAKRSVDASMVLLDNRANVLSLHVSAPRPGFLLFSEIYYPGWVARVDQVDTPLYRADGALRAIAISGGSHDVSMRFESRTFRIAAWITLATLIVTAIGWLFAPGATPMTDTSTAVTLFG